MKLIRNIILTLLAIIIVLFISLRLLYGGGEYYPDLSTKPRLTAAEANFEIAATSEEPIGNAAVSADGRLFFTIHPESRPENNKLLEWVEGQAVPYPNATAQAELPPMLGLAIDLQNRLWAIAPGDYGISGARLLAFDLNTNELVHDYQFSSEVAPIGSFLQDLQVDSTGETVYIADVSFFRKDPGLVVYDVTQETAWRVLEDHPSVYPQDWIIRNPIKEMVFFGGIIALKPGIDGIALDKNDEWLYYAAMTHDGLYRIHTENLKNRTLSATEMAAKVEYFSPKPLNDGLSIDLEGNIYITDVEHEGVAVVNQARQLETLLRDERIRWADALTFGPDGWLYVADSVIPEQMLQSKANMAAAAPYYIFRFKPGSMGVPGQ